MKQFQIKFISLMAVLSLSSCEFFQPYKVPILQGNIYTAEDLEKLQKGMTKDQVKFVLGTPLINDPFHDKRWDYYNSVKVGDTLISEEKLIILFDQNDTLEMWTTEKLNNE
jgi:outer membrane protein assembly factor BamE